MMYNPLWFSYSFSIWSCRTSYEVPIHQLAVGEANTITATPYLLSKMATWMSIWETWWLGQTLCAKMREVLLGDTQRWATITVPTHPHGTTITGKAEADRVIERSDRYSDQFELTLLVAGVKWYVYNVMLCIYYRAVYLTCTFRLILCRHIPFRHVHLGVYL